MYAKTRVRRDAGEVGVFVSDNGRRVPSDEQRRLLALLGHEKTGISFCREVVGAHGGRLWIAPGRSAGAEFVFTLPVKRLVGSVGSTAPRGHKAASQLQKKGEAR